MEATPGGVGRRGWAGTLWVEATSGLTLPSPTHTPITAAPMVAVQPWPIVPKRLLPAWTATPTIIICTNRVDPW